MPQSRLKAVAKRPVPTPHFQTAGEIPAGRFQGRQFGPVEFGVPVVPAVVASGGGGGEAGGHITLLP